jgi:ribulose 1,5-bisphosphate carboxylase large subunit-like protein
MPPGTKTTGKGADRGIEGSSDWTGRTGRPATGQAMLPAHGVRVNHEPLEKYANQLLAAT